MRRDSPRLGGRERGAELECHALGTPSRRSYGVEPMARTDVLAIEVKQYVYADDHGEHQTIVPRVIGNTETAKHTKRARSTVTMTNRTSLIAALENEDPAAAHAAAAVLDWGENQPNLSVRWTRAGDLGSASSGPCFGSGPKARSNSRSTRFARSSMDGTNGSRDCSSASSRSMASPSRATGDSGRAQRWLLSRNRRSGNSSLRSWLRWSEASTRRPEPAAEAVTARDAAFRKSPDGTALEPRGHHSSPA